MPISNGRETEFEAIKTNGSQLETVSEFVVTQGADGTQGKILGENISLSVVPPVTNFTPVTPNIKGYFQGVDTALDALNALNALKANLASPTFTGNASFEMASLPITTASTIGVINKGGERYFHDFKSPTGSAQGENVFLGRIAGNFTMTSGGVDGTSNASFNTGVGAMSLTSLTSGWSNVGTGYQSLFTLTSGKYNTATGVHALGRATTSDRNSAFGHYAGYENTTGFENSIFGASALRGNFTGSYNSFFGTESGYLSVNASYNAAFGYRSLYKAIGGYNTAVGMNSFLNSTTAQEGVAIGFASLSNVTTGNKNVAVGANSGAALTTAESCVFIGNEAGYRETGSQRLYIDNQARSTDEATARRTAMIYGVFNTSVASQFLDFNVNRINVNSGVVNENGRLSSTGVGFSRPSDNSVVAYFSKGLDLGVEGNARVWGYDGIQFKTQGGETAKATITASGKLLVGTGTDNGQGVIQANGNITASPATLANQVVVYSQLGAQPKKYTALISQVSTSAPTVTVLENTLSGAIVWTRTVAGNYVGTLSGAFTTGKTIIFQGNGTSNTIVSSVVSSVNAVAVVTTQAGVNADGLLTNTALEIRVYP